MVTRLEVDVVIAGSDGLAAFAKELSRPGCGRRARARRDAQHEPDFAIPQIRDEPKLIVRQALMMNPARDTLTFRNRQADTAPPMRQLGSFLPGEGVGGAGVHWNGVTWRWTGSITRCDRITSSVTASARPPDMPVTGR